MNAITLDSFFESTEIESDYLKTQIEGVLSMIQSLKGGRSFLFG
jgi:hypothetical protein